MSMRKIIVTLANALKSNWLGRTVYPFFSKVWHLYADPARRKRLQKNGYSLLSEIFEISKKECLNLFPMYGTLLGFEREGGFIPWDDDIDLGFIDENDSIKRVADVLVKKYNFAFYHALKYHERIAEFTLVRNNITVDFFPLHKEDDSLMAKAFYWREDVEYDSTNANSAYYMRHPMIDSLVPMTVHGVEIMVPQNKLDVIVAEFGENWRVPNANFSEMELPAFIGKDDFGYAVEEPEFWSLLDN